MTRVFSVVHRYNYEWDEEVGGFWIDEDRAKVQQNLVDGKLNAVLIFLHGGGGCIGNALLPYPALNAWKRRLEKQNLQVSIISLEYGIFLLMVINETERARVALAPEYSFPYPVHQVIEKVQQLKTSLNLTNTPIILGN